MLHLLKIRERFFLELLDWISCKDRRILYQLSGLSATSGSFSTWGHGTGACNSPPYLYTSAPGNLSRPFYLFSVQLLLSVLNSSVPILLLSGQIPKSLFAPVIVRPELNELSASSWFYLWLVLFLFHTQPRPLNPVFSVEPKTPFVIKETM